MIQEVFAVDYLWCVKEPQQHAQPSQKLHLLFTRLSLSATEKYDRSRDVGEQAAKLMFCLCARSQLNFIYLDSLIWNHEKWPSTLNGDAALLLCNCV